MNVYLVEHCINYEGSTLVGVFSTRDKAAAYADKAPVDWVHEWYNILEMEVDAEE